MIPVGGSREAFLHDGALLPQEDRLHSWLESQSPQGRGFHPPIALVKEQVANAAELEPK